MSFGRDASCDGAPSRRHGVPDIAVQPPTAVTASRPNNEIFDHHLSAANLQIGLAGHVARNPQIACGRPAIEEFWRSAANALGLADAALSDRAPPT